MEQLCFKMRNATHHNVHLLQHTIKAIQPLSMRFHYLLRLSTTRPTFAALLCQLSLLLQYFLLWLIVAFLALQDS